MVKKYLQSPTLALAVVCFLLAGISFLAPKQKTNQTVVHHAVIPPTSPVLRVETTVAPTEVVVTQVVYPTITLIPTQTTTTSTTNSSQSSNPQIAMTISEPDGTFSFSLPIENTICDELTEAKNEGKIKSLTLNWYASFNSYYVYEINGYTNNWTFTYNGQSVDHGCSYYHPSNGSSVVFKFG